MHSSHPPAAATIRQYSQSHYTRCALPLPSLIMTCTHLMPPRRFNMIKYIILVVLVALGQLIMKSLAKHGSADSFFWETWSTLTNLFTSKLVNSCLFWNNRERWLNKCGFASVKPQESHKWSVHRIHWARKIWWVLWKEHQAQCCQRRQRISFEIKI